MASSQPLGNLQSVLNSPAIGKVLPANQTKSTTPSIGQQSQGLLSAVGGLLKGPAIQAPQTNTGVKFGSGFGALSNPNYNISTQSVGGLTLPSITGSVGVQAKGPGTNVTPPVNTLTAAQTAPPKTPISTPQTTGQATSNQGIPLPQSGSVGPQYNSGSPASQTYLPGTPQNTGANPNPAQQYTPGDTLPQSGANGPGTYAAPQTATNGQQGLYPSLISGLQTLAGGNNAIGQQAQNIANTAGQQISQVGQQAAGMENAYNTTPGIAFPTAQGLAQNVGQTAAAQEQAIATGATQALQGTSQALTGQNQAQQGLYQAAGLASPANSNYTYTPGTVTQNSITGQTTNAPQLGPIGTQQYYTPGQDNSSQYGTGPAAGANVQSISDLTTQVNNWASARSAANQIVQNQLTPFLQQNSVNPSDLNAVNQFLQAIGAQTSSTQYKQLSNLMTDIAQTYAQVLTPPGQDPSVWISQTAQGLLNSTSAGQSIYNVVQSLDSQAQSKIQGVQNTISKLQTGQNVNSGSSAPASSGSTGNTGGTIQTPYGSINPNL